MAIMKLRVSSPEEKEAPVSYENIQTIGGQDVNTVSIPDYNQMGKEEEEDTFSFANIQPIKEEAYEAYKGNKNSANLARVFGVDPNGYPQFIKASQKNFESLKVDVGKRAKDFLGSSANTMKLVGNLMQIVSDEKSPITRVVNTANRMLGNEKSPEIIEMLGKDVKRGYNSMHMLFALKDVLEKYYADKEDYKVSQGEANTMEQLSSGYRKGSEYVTKAVNAMGKKYHVI